jgi:tetratricopeptide (TPR) repeat protein
MMSPSLTTSTTTTISPHETLPSSTAKAEHRSDSTNMNSSSMLLAGYKHQLSRSFSSNSSFTTGTAQSSPVSFHVLAGDTTTTNTLLPQVLRDIQNASDDADPRTLAETWNALGLIRLHTQGNAVAALQCHQQALHSLQQSQNQSLQSQYPMERAVTLNDMAYCYERLVQQELALEMYEQALGLFLQQTGVDESHPRLISIRRNMCRLQRV